MPPKVYVPAYPAGDFRAMPALGGGHALLKWVTSFPGNPAQGLPTVMGLVLLSDASNGSLRAALDAGAVTALRTGAAAVLAAETLGRSNAETAAVVGAGVNGIAAARTFLARGRDVALYDVDPGARRGAPPTSSARTSRRRSRKALAADLLVTDDARARGAAPGRLAPARPAREPDGRGRPWKGRDRRRRAAAHADLRRRLGAGEPQRRARARGRGRQARAREE